METALNAALKYAERGWPVFPVRAGLKTPATEHGHKDATVDKAQIRRWFTKTDYNIGIAMGTRSGVWAFDVDNKKPDQYDVNGIQNAELLSLMYGDLPDTLRQDTPSGGHHLLFQLPLDGIPNSKAGLERRGFYGIDIKSDGGYVVAAPSHTADGVYKMSDQPVMDAPNWLVDMIRDGISSSTSKTVYTGPTASAAALYKAEAWMKDREPAVMFQGGDAWTYSTACMLVRDLGLNEDDAFRLMMEWNERCEPPWSELGLRNKIGSAIRNGIGEIGSEDPAKDFSEYAGKDIPDTEEGLMSKMNRWFKVVDDRGQLVIYRQVYDETMGRFEWNRYKKNGFLEVCQSQLMLGMVETGGKKVMSAGQFWLDVYKKKQTYSGLTMMPECSEERTPYGKLNLWKGFAVKAIPGDWSLLKDLIYEVLCDWDDKSYRYILNWMAKAVQMPWKPAGTALVFKGKKGAGKGTLGRAFMRLFGQHGMHITSRYQLSERFNAHLRDCIALFADEAYWAGDKAGESRLKGFITEPFLTYEAKGRDPEMGRNQLHIIMASNSDWIIPAGVDNERRFAVFEAADDSDMNRELWAALNHQLDNGGLEAMLHELMHRDISEFDVFKVPKTRALAEQKMYTMDPMIDWLLNSARVGWSDMMADEDGNFQTNDVYSSYLRYCESLKTRPQSQTSFGIALRKYMPEHLLTKKQLMKTGQRNYFYEFARPEECVKHLSTMFGVKDLLAE